MALNNVSFFVLILDTYSFYLQNKRLIVLSSFVVLVSLLTILNYTFSAFTNRSENRIANIKVADMEYSLSINDIPGTIITANKNNVTKTNISITSLNNIESKYELIYNICSDSTCTNFINKPENLNIEYSSRTPNTISGAIVPSGNKNIRIITTNNTNDTYYIKLDINAGYIHNTLALKNLITTEYNEEDVKIAAIIDGEISTTFPTNNNYGTKVTCTTNDGPSNATGTASWNGTKWILNVSGVDSGRTICNVEFFVSLRGLIIAQGGGVDAINARGTPNFNEINGTSGIYATDDEYGTSYYYRGLKDELNNNIIWAGFQWKIIRINGDGTVRLIYNGTEEQFNTNGTVNSTGINTQITSAAWNSTNYNDAKYVGYMYGGDNGVASTIRHGTTSVAATYNQTSTNAKTTLDNWYQTNIQNKGYSGIVSDNLFCNDRQLQSEVGGSSTGPGYGNTWTTTYYAAYQRLNTTKNPTLKCGLKNDRFTVNDTVLGNGNLTYPVGLITADEAAMAGLRLGTSNSTNYLYTNSTYWSFSPHSMGSGGYAIVFYVYSPGYLNNDNVNPRHGLRPAVSISETHVTGTGSANDPYRAI